MRPSFAPGARLLLAAPLLALVVATSGFTLRDPGVTWGCDSFEYRINTGDAGRRQVRAVHLAAREFAAASGRTPAFSGYTTDRRSEGAGGPHQPVLIEFYWPDDAPTAQGFAEPFIVGDHYVGGSVYLHPNLERARPGHVYRMTLHELGHIGGLHHTRDRQDVMYPSPRARTYSSSDRAGLAQTHDLCLDRGPAWHKTA